MKLNECIEKITKIVRPEFTTGDNSVLVLITDGKNSGVMMGGDPAQRLAEMVVPVIETVRAITPLEEAQKRIIELFTEDVFKKLEKPADKFDISIKSDREISAAELRQLLGVSDDEQ